MNKKLIALVVTVLLIILQACSRQPHVKGHIVPIESRSFASTLFYSGIIQPLNTHVIPCPADGVVVEMPVQYGEVVQSDQLLFMLSSTKFISDYKAALLVYLKAKSDFNNTQSQLDEAIFLHKNGLISDDDFKSKQTNFYATQLALLQAKDVLENLIHQLGIKDSNVYKLSIADIDKISEAMHSQMSSEHLRVTAPASGILLSPSKTEEDNKKLLKGDQVKQGDVLAIIGDMSGISVRVKVNELTVNQLKIGQKVKITGIAFPDETLLGTINRVDRQGTNSNGGLPTFDVEVIVSTLTEEQRKQIHVGMSAKVEINIEAEPQIMAPINAIKEMNGESYLKIYDEKAKKVRVVAVKTGKSTIDSVAIISGLKMGDKIVIPD